MRRIGSSRSWLGANAAAALGTVLAAEGKFVEAEHELVTAERFFADEVATVHHTWLLVLLARCRLRRGRLDEAQPLLRSAREALDELTDSGIVEPLCDEVERELRTAKGPGSRRRAARGANRGRARRAADSWLRPVGTRDRRAALPLAQHDPVTHPHDLPQARTSTPARTPSHARPRSASSSKRDHPSERRTSPR